MVAELKVGSMIRVQGADGAEYVGLILQLIRKGNPQRWGQKWPFSTWRVSTGQGIEVWKFGGSSSLVDEYIPGGEYSAGRAFGFNNWQPL